MDNEHPLARDLLASVTEHSRLPARFVRQVITALKAQDRVDSARPIAPPVTPRAIARIFLALTSPTLKDAVATEKAVGALRLATGYGQPSVEDELVDIVEEAAGWRNGNSNFRDGLVMVGHDGGTVIIGDSTYRDETARKGGVNRYVLIPLSAIARVARDLLPVERVHV